MSETNTVSPLRQRMIEDMTARKLVEIASGIEPVQDGRIYIEKIASFLYAGRIQGGLQQAIANGLLWLHESGTYLRLTEAGAALSA